MKDFSETPENYVGEVFKLMLEELPDNDEILNWLYALLALTKGETTSLRDVHDAWSFWKDLSNPRHSSLIPFDKLTPETQELDRPYMEAIHRVARKL